MKLQAIFLICLLFIINGVFCDDNEENRKLNVTKNPGCKEYNETICDKFTLVYIVAESNLNTLHYLWDFSAKPSILIAKTDKNATLNIDWSNFDGNTKCINFTSKPDYVFSSVIKSIILFNDTSGNSNYSEPSNVNAMIFNPVDLEWTLMNLTEKDQQIVTLEMNATHINNGSFSIKYTAYGSANHGADLPHLFHTAHSMQIDVIAQKIHSNYSSPRIAIELLMVSTELNGEGHYQMNRIRNLDDEFTPGIFDVYNLLTPRSNNGSRGGFIQYRPVCYISHVRTVSSSTESRHGNPISLGSNFEEFKLSLPMDYFNKTEMTQNLKTALNITFGMPNDGFYSRTNYISFSYLMGIGSPASEGLSPFVYTFAAIGLGVPLIVLIGGGTYVAIKRYS